MMRQRKLRVAERKAQPVPARLREGLLAGPQRSEPLVVAVHEGPLRRRQRLLQRESSLVSRGAATSTPQRHQGSAARTT